MFGPAIQHPISSLDPRDMAPVAFLAAVAAVRLVGGSPEPATGVGTSQFLAKRAQGQLATHGILRV